MADPRRRNLKDRGGDWFIDQTCIDCDVARQLAPGLIEEDASGLSFFSRPPKTPDEVLRAWRALLACPSGSIGAPKGAKAPAEAFPLSITDEVFLLGYHSSDSFGAHAYLANDAAGNLMVDSPRFVPALVDAIAARGGLQHILLTHRDDVADAKRFANHFGARVWIGADDLDAAPFADEPIREETLIRADLRAIPFPGHTRGSALYLWKGRFLFTGDSLAFSRTTKDLIAFRDATWHSWTALTESMAGLEKRSFEWVLPGHGSWGHDSRDAMRRRVQQLVRRMRQTNADPTW